MKGSFWRKTAAACLAVMIVSGSTPVQPFADAFASRVCTVYAADETACNISVAANVQHGKVTPGQQTAAPGETVTLTVTPDNGYAVGSVTMNGETLEPVDGSYSFIMPEEDAVLNAEFVLPSVSYIDSSGNRQILQPAQYRLLNGEITGYKAGFFVVDGVVEYTGNLVLANTTTIILKDNAELHIHAGPNNGIRINTGKLTICGQEGGTGKLIIDGQSKGILMSQLYLSNIIANINSTGSGIEGSELHVKNSKLTICSKTNHAISGAVYFNGGQITATANQPNKDGIYSPYKSITLNFPNLDDFIYASSYSLGNRVTMTLPTDVTLTNGEKIISGTLTEADMPELAGKTLGRALTVSIAETVGNGSVSASPYAAAGSTVILNMAPGTGYTVRSVRVNGGTVPVTALPDGSYSFVMPAEDVAVSTEFAQKKYNIAFEGAENGSVSAEVGNIGAEDAYPGETVTLNVTPATGYTVQRVLLNGAELTPVNGAYTFTMPDKDVLVGVEFAQNEYAVAVSSNGNSTVTALVNGNAAGTAHYGDTVALDITTAPGYAVQRVSVNGQTLTPVNGVYSFPMPAENAAVSVETVRSIYGLSVRSMGSGTVTVKVNGTNANTAHYGDTVTLNAAPNTGYALQSVSLNGTEITLTDGAYTFDMPESNVIIDTVFVQNDYSVALSSSANGTASFRVNGAETATAHYWENVTLDITPDTGYLTESVTVNGEPLAPVNGAYSFPMPAENVSIRVQFAQADYTVAVEAAENGTVTALVNGAEAGSAHCGDTVTLNVTPDTGCAVQRVLVSGEEIALTDGAYTFTMSDSDVTVSAEFVQIGYTLTADGIQNSTVSFTVNGENAEIAHYGDTVTLNVTPDTGYIVRSVTVNGTEITLTNGAYTFTMSDENVRVSAEVVYPVTITSIDVNNISTPQTVYAELFTGADYIVPPGIYRDGYTFTGWNVNGTLYTAEDAVQAAVMALVQAKTAVTVTIVYEESTETFPVMVTGGTFSDGSTEQTIQVAKLVTVTADAAPAGKQFSHWMRNGLKVSSNASYSFYMPAEDITLEAVFVTGAVEVTGTAIIESVKPNEAAGKVSFVSVVNVPTCCTMVKGGLVATNNSSIGEAVTAENAAFVKLSTKVSAKTKNLKYTWTKGNVTESTVWYVRAYLVYTDANGTEHTVYSDAVKANIHGAF